MIFNSKRPQVPARRKGMKTRKVRLVPVKRNVAVAVAVKRVKNRLKRLRRGLNNPSLGGSSAYNGNRMRAQLVRGPAMTEAGMCFLKCAFAPPDFSATQVRGIPDNYRGTTLLKQHRINTTLTVSAGTDYYLILMPVPGYAYFTTSVVAGTNILATTAYTGVPYSDFSAMFGTVGTTAGVVTSFRHVSNHIELITTTNEMTWSGTITSWKLPVKINIRQGGSAGDLYAINGFESMNSTNANMYSGASKAGIYAAGYNAGADFEFTNIMENIGTIPTGVMSGVDFGQIVTSAFTGFDNNFETVVVKISGLTTTNTFILKTWSCVEYRAQANSSVYEYQTVSPPLDEKALSVYREVILSLPVAVPSAQNAGFWSRVLSIIKVISGVGSSLPGPYGMVSTGINAIAGGIQQMTM